MERDLENKFFREFQYDGAAIMSLEMMMFEHCGIGNGTASRKDYPDGVLAGIRERTETLNAWPWGGVENCSPLMDEIADNIACRPKDAREMYAEELICKMQTWTWLYSLSKDKLDAVSNTIRLHSIEDFFFTWRSAFRAFAEKLAVILAKLGINILDIQNRSGITLIEQLDANELWQDFGTPQLAAYYLPKPNEPRINSECNGKRGRPKSDEAPFVSLLMGDTRERENIMQIFHQIIDGKRGKVVACAILACFRAGKLISLPSYKQVVGVFGKGIGNAKGYSRYTCIEEYNDDKKPKSKALFEEMLKRFKS